MQIQSHDFLAEHLINTLGDIPTALHLYRLKQRLQQQFAATFDLEDGILYLPADWVRNIGHLALLDFWVKMQHLGWRNWKKMILLAPPDATANTAYLGYWKQHFTVITDPHLLQVHTLLADCLGNRVAGPLPLACRPDHYFCEGMGLIQEEWEQQGRPPVLELREEDRERGWAKLLELGVPQGSWFVTLHVRSSGYHKERETDHQGHRNADIQTYFAAIKEIISLGGWVIRLGDRSMEPLPAMPGLIDYAHYPQKEPWMDVFLCACCRFFIGVASGPSQVPMTFGVPSVLTNWVSNPLPVYSSQDLFIPKLLWSTSEKRFLTFWEAFQPDIRRLGYCGRKLLQSDLRPIENTSEDILEVVQEMLGHLDGSNGTTPGDAELQTTFREIALERGLVGFSRVGRNFLRKYAHLLTIPEDTRLRAG